MFTHLLIYSTVHRLQIKVADSYNWSVFTEGNRMLFWSLFCRNLPHTPITVHWLNALTSKCIKQIYQPSAEGAGLLKLYTIFWNILQLYKKWTMIVKPRIMFFFFFFFWIFTIVWLHGVVAMGLWFVEIWSVNFKSNQPIKPNQITCWCVYALALAALDVQCFCEDRCT